MPTQTSKILSYIQSLIDELNYSKWACLSLKLGLPSTSELISVPDTTIPIDFKTKFKSFLTTTELTQEQTSASWITIDLLSVLRMTFPTCIDLDYILSSKSNVPSIQHIAKLELDRANLVLMQSEFDSKKQAKRKELLRKKENLTRKLTAIETELDSLDSTSFDQLIKQTKNIDEELTYFKNKLKHEKLNQDCQDTH